MSEVLTISLLWPVLAGAVLGSVFFAGLWWTIAKSTSVKSPLLWLLGSLLARMMMVLLGFYWVADGHWQRLMACLVGFIITRAMLTRFLPAPIELTTTTKEANHAP